MSINRRTALAVRSLGVASAAAALAVGVAGTAFACSISEFTPAASCESGHGVITVLDKDVSHTPVDITLEQGNTVVGTQKQVVGSDEGVTVTFKVDWAPSTTYTVKVVKSAGGTVGTKDVTTPDQACGTHTTPSTTPPTTPETTPPTTAAAATTAPSTSVAAVAATVPAPSPSANLAETGGGSNTGMLVSIAGALVVAGGGTVFMLRRRTAGAHH